MQICRVFSIPVTYAHVVVMPLPSNYYTSTGGKSGFKFFNITHILWIKYAYKNNMQLRWRSTGIPTHLFEILLSQIQGLLCILAAVLVSKQLFSNIAIHFSPLMG